MFSKNKFYSIYVNSESSEPLADLETVKNGFNIWAFLFTGLWAIFNRAWFLALIVLIVQFIFVLFVKSSILSEDSINILSFIFSVWVGFEAGNYKEESLKRKNFVLFDIVYASGEDEAKLRFIDKYNANKIQSDLKTKGVSEEIIFDDINLGSSNSFA